MNQSLRRSRQVSSNARLAPRARAAAIIAEPRTLASATAFGARRLDAFPPAAPSLITH